MVLAAPGQPLALVERPDPAPGPGEIAVRIEACGVCRTDLHIVDGELPGIRFPIVPGHEIVGIVDKVGPNAIDVRRHLAHARHAEWQRSARQSQPRIAATAGASADNRVFGMLACAAAVIAATFGALVYSLMPADEWTAFQREHGCEVAANTDPTIAQLRCPDGRTIVRSSKVAGGVDGTSRKPLR